jgi:hypothetical protein
MTLSRDTTVLDCGLCGSNTIISTRAVHVLKVATLVFFALSALLVINITHRPS